jgi:thiosulfate dehydrogenase
MKKLIALAFVVLSIGVVSADDSQDDLPKHQLPVSANGNLVVGSCDGKTALEVPGKKDGDKLSDAEARQVSNQLMDEWKKKNPGKSWDMASREPQSSEASSNAVSAPAPSKTQQGIYSNYTPEDRKIWEIEQGKLIAEGKAIFHSADRLKSRTAISCDMCHPNAANTHPETYPKYQVQLQRVAMLRDMINWCIENPVKGVMLKDQDPNMKALEAYIISQRRGIALDPGKH